MTDIFIATDTGSSGINVELSTGSDGAPGSQITTGSGAPSDSDGSNGDFYLDTASNDYYTKAAGAWSLSGNLGASGSSGYTTVAEEGTSLAQQHILNFIGASLTAANNSGSSRTDVTLAQSPSGSTSVVGTGRTLSTTAPLTGGGDLSSDRTLAMPKATASVDGYLAGTDFTTFAAKQAAGSYLTALTSDVSASGPGSAAATVNAVGGSSAANVHAAELAANAATDANTASKIVKRDVSGNFSAGTVTASLTGHASLDLLASSNLSDVASAATARTNLGLAIGSNVQAYNASTLLESICITIDGGGSVISTGSKGKLPIPFGMTITKWKVSADQSGSIVVDLKILGSSIIGTGNKPTLSSAADANASVSGWTSVALAEDDRLEFVVSSAATVQRVVIELLAVKT